MSYSKQEIISIIKRDYIDGTGSLNKTDDEKIIDDTESIEVKKIINDKFKIISINNCINVLVDTLFDNDENLEDLIIPEGIHFIFSSSFRNYDSHSFRKITFSKSLIGIGAYTFYFLSIEEVVFQGNKLRYLGTRCSENTNISEIRFPNSLEFIGFRCFSYTKIKKLTIPKNINFIGSYAFSECYNLEKVIIKSDKLKEISAACFEMNYSLKSIIIESKSISEIKEYAFFKCVSLKNLNLDSVKYIGRKSFNFCYNLENISLVGLGKFSYSAFDECCKLNNIKFGNNINIETISKCDLFNKKIYFPKKTVDKLKVIIKFYGNDDYQKIYNLKRLFSENEIIEY